MQHKKKKMLMFKQWGNGKCKGKVAGRHASELNTALQLFYLCELNLGLRGYKQLVSSGQNCHSLTGKT